jgi:hypothetical protein
MSTIKKTKPKKQHISKTKEIILQKYFGKVPAFGDGLTYQHKLRAK